LQTRFCFPAKATKHLFDDNLSSGEEIDIQQLAWLLDTVGAKPYLRRRLAVLQEIIDTSRVFGKRYNAAVDELEEIEELLDINQ
jgi:hypothetical protein